VILWFCRRFLLLPEALGDGIAVLIARLVFGVFGLRRKIVDKNLQTAFPLLDVSERRSIARAHHAMLGRSLPQFIRSLVEPIDHLRGRFVGPGLETLQREWEEAKRRDEGLILVTAHFGNWEMLAVSVARLGIPLSVVSRRLKVRLLDRAWARVRREVGLREHEARGSGREILRALASGGLVGMVIDQHIPPPMGLVLSFFGVPAYTTPAPAVLARRARVKILELYLHPLRERGRFELRVRAFSASAGRDHAAIVADSQRLNHHLEAEILRTPEAWLWLHRRWKGASGRPLALGDEASALENSSAALKSGPPLDVADKCVRRG